MKVKLNKADRRMVVRALLDLRRERDGYKQRAITLAVPSDDCSCPACNDLRALQERNDQVNTALQAEIDRIDAILEEIER